MNVFLYIPTLNIINSADLSHKLYIEKRFKKPEFYSNTVQFIYIIYIFLLPFVNDFIL